MWISKLVVWPKNRWSKKGDPGVEKFEPHYFLIFWPQMNQIKQKKNHF